MKAPRKPRPTHGPITLVVPSTTTEKMNAITSLCRSVESLARALNSVNTNIQISNCIVDNPNGGTGIYIGTGSENGVIEGNLMRG